MLNQRNIKKVNQMGETQAINCWGATQFALGVIDKPTWVHQPSMNEFIKKNTKYISGKNLQEGDIAVLKNHKGELVHTAIYLNNDLWWHKLGSLPTEYEKINKIEKFYSNIAEKMYGQKISISYRRYKA